MLYNKSALYTKEKEKKRKVDGSETQGAPAESIFVALFTASDGAFLSDYLTAPTTSGTGNEPDAATAVTDSVGQLPG